MEIHSDATYSQPDREVSLLTWRQAIAKAFCYRGFVAVLTVLTIMAFGGTFQVAISIVTADFLVRLAIYIAFEKLWSKIGGV